MRRMISLSILMSLALGVSAVQGQEPKPREPKPTEARMQVAEDKKSPPVKEDVADARVAPAEKKDDQRAVVAKDPDKGRVQKAESDQPAQIKPRRGVQEVQVADEKKPLPASKDKADGQRPGTPRKADDDDRAQIKPRLDPSNLRTAETKQDPAKRADKEQGRAAAADAERPEAKPRTPTTPGKKESAR